MASAAELDEEELTVESGMFNDPEASNPDDGEDDEDIGSPGDFCYRFT